MNEIKTGSAVQLFERGDYSAAYLSCDSNDNLKGCSLILLGLFERGLSLLNSSADDRTKFCSAVAYWGLNKNAAALEILEHISPDSSYHRPSKTLKKLAGAPKLRVLLQARDDPSLPSSDAVGAAKNLSMADIVTIGHSSRSDIKINLQSTIGDVIAELPAGWDPDFYLCDMVEDHPPPLGLPSAPFPTFYSTQDFDRHYHHCHGVLSEFDAGIAFGSVFHKELEQLTNGPTFVCPLLMGVDNQDTHVDLVPKEFDMFVSGNLFNHSKQKTKYLWELSQLSEKYNFKYLNTHTSVEKYKEYLRKSKYTFTYVQNWGITNSRAFEAIIEGCGAFFQEGSELGIFLSDCVEAVSYREDNLISVVGEALKKSDKKPAAETRSSADKAREIYQFDGCRERYIKLIAVYSTLLADSKKSKSKSSIKRFPNHSPLRIFYNYDGNPNIYLDQQADFRSSLQINSDYESLDAIGESFLYSHIFSRQIVQLQLDDQIKIVKNAGSLANKQLFYLLGYTDHHRSDYLDSACNIYKALSLNFPSRIAAHFNYGRLCAETGQEVSAIKVFEKILSDSTLVYHPNDLLFWSEFNPDFYDYENMMFAIRKFWLDNDKSQLNKIENGIRESSLFYLSEQLTKVSETTRALELLRTNINPETSLPILWFQKFKLSVLCGYKDEATQIAQNIEQNRPWILALFGEDMIKIAEMSKIKLPLIHRKVELFLKCFI